MNEISQQIYEVIEKKIQSMDNYKAFLISELAMLRTSQIIKIISENEYYNDTKVLYEYIKNNKDMFINNTNEIETNRVCEFLESSGDLVENFQLDNESENSLILGLVYPIFEEWYYFINNIKYKVYDNKEAMTSFITLPIRYLDDYLADFYSDQYTTNELQAHINEDELIQNEIKRIQADFNFIEIFDKKDKISRYEKMEEYFNLNILAK